MFVCTMYEYYKEIMSDEAEAFIWLSRDPIGEDGGINMYPRWKYCCKNKR